MGVVSCGIGGLVVGHVGRRLLLGRSPRQCAMPPHNGNFLMRALPKDAALRRLFKSKKSFFPNFVVVPFLFKKKLCPLAKKR